MECSNRLDELVVKYENTLFRAALAILGDVQEAEDAVQDTFLRYLEKRPAFRDGEHERAWLLKVTANRCKSALRVWKRRPTVELLDIYPAPEEDGGHPGPARQPARGGSPALLRGLHLGRDRGHPGPAARDGALPFEPGAGRAAAVFI